MIAVTLILNTRTRKTIIFIHLFRLWYRWYSFIFCSRPSIGLTVQNRGLKHHSFIHSFIHSSCVFQIWYFPGLNLYFFLSSLIVSICHICIFRCDIVVCFTVFICKSYTVTWRLYIMPFSTWHSMTLCKGNLALQMGQYTPIQGLFVETIRIE